LREAAYFEIELNPNPEPFDDMENGPLMTNDEFDAELALAAAGEGDLFADSPAGEFRPSTAEEFLAG
jgi:hypothetical protein